MFGLFKRDKFEPYVSPPVPSDDDLVSTAPHVMYPCTNVARGTIGYSILRLRNAGRLVERVEYGVLPDETRYIYEAVK